MIEEYDLTVRYIGEKRLSTSISPHCNKGKSGRNSTMSAYRVF